MQSKLTPKVHLLYLDSLRGLAAGLVVMHHALLQFDFSDVVLTAPQRFLLYLFSDGHYAVNFFIVLSGYCLMLPAARANYQLPGGATRFFRKRARRILPPYYLAMGLSLLLIWLFIGQKTGTHWDVSIPVTPTDVVTHVLLIQDVFANTGGKINHAFWSISVEWRIYFAFPLLLLGWRRLGALRTVLVVAVVAFGLVALLRSLHHAYPLLNNSPNGIVPHYLLLFTLGMLGADVAFAPQSALAHWPPRRWALALAGLTVILLLVSALPALTGRSLPWQVADVLVGLWGLSLLVCCHHLPPPPGAGWQARLHAALAWRPLVLVGTFGYSLYLVHAPLLQLLTQYVLAPLGVDAFTGFVLLATVGFLVILALCYGFFLLCEKPFMTKRYPAPVAAVVEPAL